MTNLMQQLQAWADRGLYDWDNPTLDEGFKWMQMGSSDIRDFQPFEAFRFVDSWEPFVQCVLDGTIQVWRPVEHYKPKDNEPVLLYDPAHTDQDGEPLTTVIGYYREEDGEFHRFEIYRNAFTLMSPTHWQPLPQLQQEVK
jgi:hypothetical protein